MRGSYSASTVSRCRNNKRRTPNFREMYAIHDYRLASLLVDAAIGDHGVGRITRDRAADRLLDCILASALEVSGRSRGSAAHRASADCARILRSGGARTTQ